MVHTCKAPGCAKRINGVMLMCLQHWRKVPGHIQKEINRSWSNLRRGVTEDNYAAYQQARAAAIAALNNQSSIINHPSRPSVSSVPSVVNP